MLGYEIVEVLNRRGGIVLLKNMIGSYKLVNGKNLDPSKYWFYILIGELVVFVKIMGKTTYLALR
jgi:hypothetical protein